MDEEDLGALALLPDRAAAASIVASRRESLVRSVDGAAWDNVAWLGPWEIDLADVRRPVHLWYGGQDPRHPAGDGPGLRDHLPDATLHLAPDDGHLAVVAHIDEILTTLTTD